MTARFVRLSDPSGTAVATARVCDRGSYFGGEIDLTATPTHLVKLFDEFEEVVNGQMFTFADEIQEKIAAHGITATLDDGTTFDVDDLQVFPGTGAVSFRPAGQRRAAPEFSAVGRADA